jgi:hypothetical protein
MVLSLLLVWEDPIPYPLQIAAGLGTEVYWNLRGKPIIPPRYHGKRKMRSFLFSGITPMLIVDFFFMLTGYG